MEKYVYISKFSNTAIDESMLSGYRAKDIADKLNAGKSLNRDDKNWLSRNINYGHGGVKVMGWLFDYSDFMKIFLIKRFGNWEEVWAMDKISIRSTIYGKVEKLIDITDL